MRIAVFVATHRLLKSGITFYDILAHMRIFRSFDIYAKTV